MCILVCVYSCVCVCACVCVSLRLRTAHRVLCLRASSSALADGILRPSCDMRNAPSPRHATPASDCRDSTGDRRARTLPRACARQGPAAKVRFSLSSRTAPRRTRIALNFEPDRFGRLRALNRFIVAMPPARYAVDEDEIYVPPVADAYGEYRSANTESEWVPVGR